MNSTTLKLILITLTLSFSGTVQSVCFDLVNTLVKRKAKSYLNIPELELMKKIEAVEKASNGLRKIKNNADPAINISIGRKIALLDSNLMINQWSVAHRSTKNLFRQVEIAYVLIKRHDPILKELKSADLNLGREELLRVLKKAKTPQNYQKVLLESFDKHGSLSKFAKDLELETHSQLIRLGNKYHEYALIRYHLEDILEDTNCSNAVCQRNVKTLLDRIGIASDKERVRFARVIGDLKRPPIDELSKMLNEHPVVLLTRLKKERNYELFAVVRDFILQPEIVERMFKGLYNLPGFNRVKAVRILKLVYNAQARNLHFPKINRIVRSTLPIDQKFPILKEINTTVDYDELLVTFARRVDDATADTWKTIKEYAEANDKDFLERIVKAEKKAKARGEISLTQDKSVVAKLATIIATGSSIGYFYFLGDEPEVVEVNDGQNSDLPVDSLNNVSNEDTITTPPAPNSDEHDEIVFSSDENIEIEGDMERAIEQLHDEVEAIQSQNGGQDRGPSSIQPFNWFIEFINFIFSF